MCPTIYPKLDGEKLNAYFPQVIRTMQNVNKPNPGLEHVLYTHIINMLIYTYTCSCSITTTPWIIKQTRNDKVTGINDTHRKTQEDFFIKYFTSHFICKVSKRVTQSLHVRGSWRPNIIEIFWPRSYGRHRCVFLVLYGCSTEHWESTLRGAGFSYYIASMSVSNYTACPQLYSPVCALTCLNSSALYYLQTPTRWYGHASTTTSDIWGLGCATSAFFGLACVIVIERK